MLRFGSPFVLASAGGMIALLGDKLWLVYDTLVKPANDGLPHGVVYALIGLTFSLGLALMAWAIVLYRRNGYAALEIRDEIAHRRGELQRRRFALFSERARLAGRRLIGRPS